VEREGGALSRETHAIGSKLTTRRNPIAAQTGFDRLRRP
jgi:hypothetical protein